MHNGGYQNSISANMLEPVYHEMAGMTWGIIGFGNIGRGVAKIADAFGCHVLVNKRTPIDDYECVELDYLIKNSDIISIHCPLTDKTRGMIGKEQLSMMKKNAVVINVARGAVGFGHGILIQGLELQANGNNLFTDCTQGLQEQVGVAVGIACQDLVRSKIR